MRRRLLPIPVVLLLGLAAAAPASAAEVEITASNYKFTPTPSNIALGDTVIWRFATGGHTTTAQGGQAERWNSGNKAFGESFRHTFNRPGRFQYVCIPHEGFMRGTIRSAPTRCATPSMPSEPGAAARRCGSRSS
jgi:plastocyanin